VRGAVLSLLRDLAAVGSKMAKRVRVEPLAAPIVRLNVGGTSFDTTRDTLSKCRYFEPYLEGRIGHAVDDKGRLFVDRSGVLFGHLLEFMRTGLRPPQKLVEEIRDALLAECDYFGLDWMAHNLKGQISPFDMRYEDRSIAEEELCANEGRLFDVFNAGTTPRPRAGLQLPLLLDKISPPSVLGTYADFVRRLDTFSGGMLDSLKRVPNLVIAGGSVSGALCDVEAGDLDIFVIAPPEQGEAVLRAVFNAVQANQALRKAPKLLVTRSTAAVTMFRCSQGSSTACPVQVVTTTSPTLMELLVSFDVDCCCVAWLPNEDRVVATARGIRALRHGVNVADTRFDSAPYCRRLEKYAGRGWAVGVPGLVQSRVRSELLHGSYLFLKRHDLLVKLDPKTEIGCEEMRIQTLAANARGVFEEKSLTVNTAGRQRAESVRGIARLVVMHSCNVREAAQPEVWYCGQHMKCGATEAIKTGAVCPLVLSEGKYLLLWGAGVEELDDADIEGYSTTPLASAYDLLNREFAREMETSDDTPHTDDAWWKGGVMEKLPRAMHGRCGMAGRALREHATSRLLCKKPLLYVYDFCLCTTAFDDLPFVRDAGRPPLRALEGGEFKEAYGVSRRLEFARRVFRRSHSDWWTSIY